MKKYLGILSLIVIAAIFVIWLYVFLLKASDMSIFGIVLIAILFTLLTLCMILCIVGLVAKAIKGLPLWSDEIPDIKLLKYPWYYYILRPFFWFDIFFK